MMHRTTVVLELDGCIVPRTLSRQARDTPRRGMVKAPHCHSGVSCAVTTRSSVGGSSLEGRQRRSQLLKQSHSVLFAGWSLRLSGALCNARPRARIRVESSN